MKMPCRCLLIGYCLLVGLVGVATGRDVGGVAARDDLALHRPTAGSPICKPGEEAEKAVNGLIASKTQDKFCSLQRPSWLQIDLQSVRTIRGFTLLHAGAGGEPASMNTRAFVIRTSSDGSHWDTVVSVHDNTANVSRHPITAVRARYVRLEVTVPTQDADPATRIYELEVW